MFKLWDQYDTMKVLLANQQPARSERPLGELPELGHILGRFLCFLRHNKVRLQKIGVYGVYTVIGAQTESTMKVFTKLS